MALEKRVGDENTGQGLVGHGKLSLEPRDHGIEEMRDGRITETRNYGIME